MSLMLLLATAAGSGVTAPTMNEPTDPLTPVSDPEGAGVPYAIPTSAPYNVPYITADAMPTPDGTGSMVHPSVKDFGPGKTWNGYRYWMAATPFYGSVNGVENPCILHSNDGYNWSVPVGVTNPLVPWPGAPTNQAYYNSDTELVWDPEGDRLHIFFRDCNEGAAKSEHIWVITSSDGSSWSAPTLLLSVTGAVLTNLSPTVVRVSQGDWRMWVAGSQNVYQAPAHDGPWTKVGNFTFDPAGVRHTLWHVSIIRYQGVFYMTGDAQGTGGVFPAVSIDGFNWKAGPELISPAGWLVTPYRSCIQIHPELNKFRLWYSGQSLGSSQISWRTSYTHVPKSLWDSLL